MKQLIVTIVAMPNIDFTFVMLADSPIIPLWITDIMKFVVFSAIFLFAIFLIWASWVAGDLAVFLCKKIFNKNINESSQADGDDLGISISQKIKFWIITLGPAVLWFSIIFIQALPITEGFRSFVESEKIHNLWILMAPALIWSVGRLFYGLCRGHLNPV